MVLFWCPWRPAREDASNEYHEYEPPGQTVHARPLLCISMFARETKVGTNERQTNF